MAIRKRTNKQMAVVLIQWLLFLGIPPFCLSFYYKETGELTPNDPFVFLGENLTLTCTLTNRNLAGDSRGMVFTCSQQTLDSGYLQKKGEWAFQLNFPVGVSNDRNLVVCWLHNTSGILIDSQVIHVDYPPEKVRNVSCFVDNWKNLTCTWDLPYPYEHTENLRIKTQLRRNGSGTRTITASESSLVSATWASDGKSGFVFGYSYSLRIVLIYHTSGPRGIFRKAHKLHIRTRTRVKPSPIFRWNVTFRNASAVRVGVRHSNNLHDKKIYVRYASQWNQSAWCQKVIDWPKRKEMEVDLWPLRPATEYNVSVAVGPYNPYHGFLSEWRNFTVRTLPSVPLVGPEMCAGCYAVLRCNDTAQHCHVRLYWKSIPPPLRNGVIRGYHVEVTLLPHRSLASASAPAPTTLESGMTSRVDGCVPDKWVDDLYPQLPSPVCRRSENGSWDDLVVSTSSRLTLGDSGGARLVRLYAVTSQNLISPACSFILLPPLRDRPAKVETLVVEVNEYQTHGGWDGHFYLRWTDWGSYTLFYQVVWCLGNAVTRTCAEGEDIQWLQVRERHSQLLVHDTSGWQLGPNKFLVGVSRHQRRQDGQGDVSSGIVWSSCVYIRNTAPKRVAENVGLSQGNSPGELYVTWTFYNCTSDVTTNVFVIEFVIYFCVTSSSESSCGGSERMRTVGGEKRWVMLKGLEEGRHYRVRVAPRSQWGQGHMSKAKIGVAPASIEDSGTVMVPVICGIVFILLVILACFVHRCCKHYRGVRRKFAKNLESEGTTFVTSVTDENNILTKRNDGHKPHHTRAGTRPLTSADTVLQEGKEDNADNPDFSQSSAREEDALAVTRPLLKWQKQDSTSTHGSDSGIEVQPPGGDLEEVAAAGDRTGPYVKPRLETTMQPPESPASDEHNAGSPDSEDVLLNDVSSLDSSLDDDEEDVSVPILSATTHDSSTQPVQIGGGEPCDAEETAVLKASASWDLTRPVSCAPENVVQAFAKDSGGCVVVSTKPDSLSHPQIPLSSYLDGSVTCLEDDQPAPRVTLSCDCFEEKGDPISQAADLPALKDSSAQPHSVHDYPAVSGYVPYRQEPSCAETSLTPADHTVSSQGSDVDPDPSLGIETNLESLEDNLDQLSCSSEVSLDIQDYFTRSREPEKSVKL